MISKIRKIVRKNYVYTVLCGVFGSYAAKNHLHNIYISMYSIQYITKLSLYVTIKTVGDRERENV